MKIEDKFALHISIIASRILDREISTVMVLRRQLVHRHAQRIDQLTWLFAFDGTAPSFK